MDIEFWLVFIGASIALNIAPGPDLIYILTKTISGGTRIGIAASLGVCCGAFFHVLLAAIGLSAILVSSAIAFTIVKYVGVCYLLYLAYQAFTSSTSFSLDKNVIVKNESFLSAFKQGVLIDILNPKVAIFFMAFLPQFLRDGYGTNAFQLLYLGTLVILVAIVVEVTFVLFASTITHKIQANPRYQVLLDRFVGIIFVALGLKLLTTASDH